MRDFAETVDLFIELGSQWKAETPDGVVRFGIESLSPDDLIVFDIGQILYTCDSGIPTLNSLELYKEVLCGFGIIRDTATLREVLPLLIETKGTSGLVLPTTLQLLASEGSGANVDLRRSATSQFLSLLVAMVLSIKIDLSTEPPSTEYLDAIRAYTELLSSHLESLSAIETTYRCDQCEAAYQKLELDYGASIEEVKLARRELAKSFHPDLWLERRGARSAEEQLKTINAAANHLLECRKSAQKDQVAFVQENDFNHSNDYQVEPQPLDQEPIEASATGSTKPAWGYWLLGLAGVGMLLFVICLAASSGPDTASSNSINQSEATLASQDEPAAPTDAASNSDEKPIDDRPRFQGEFISSSAMNVLFQAADSTERVWLTTLNAKDAAVRPLITIPTEIESAPARALITAASLKDENCHSCGAHVGVYLFRLQSGYWTLVAQQPDAFTHGGWEDPGKASLLPPNEGIVGFSLHTEDLHQGFGEEGTTLVQLIGEEIRPVLQIQTEDDDKGTCANGMEELQSLPPCYENSATVQYVAKEGSLPDILVTYTGTELDKDQHQNLRSVNRTDRYTFSVDSYKQVSD